ncbi:MAG: hypothetical protein QM610_07590 [Chitinophagaceae bacterium]
MTTHILNEKISKKGDSLENLKARLRAAMNSKKKLSWDSFSFDKAREILKEVKGNFSDLVIEERSESR